MAYRVVGTYEYSNALMNFDRLLASANTDELRAIDILVKRRKEFAVFTNVVRRVRSGPTSLSESYSVANDNFERRGFAWVIALARVELGGILATFSGNSSPFEAVNPSRYEMDAYKELLLDGAQTHFSAIGNDPSVIRVAKSKPGQEMLAYIRRLNLTSHFLFASFRSQLSQLKPDQITEAASQAQKVEQLRGMYVLTMKQYLAAQQQQKVTVPKHEVNGVAACHAQLQGEAIELQLGTAKITRQNIGLTK